MDSRNGMIYDRSDMDRMSPEDRRYVREMRVHPTPEQRASRKVGRNAPCPCGSQKKFKKCCLGRAEG